MATKMAMQKKDVQGCGSLEDQAENWAVSEPYFHVIFTPCQVSGVKCVMTPPLPMTRVLPEAVVPVVITYKNKDWNMTYHGEGPRKRFDIGWKKFAFANNFKVGDGCIFELIQCNTECIKFRVQILDGDIPLELIDQMDGNHVDNPISID